jgi:hypothetical protein
MTLLQLALSALRRHFPGKQQAEDAYLAGAVDIYDLERRLQQIDRRGAPQPLHLQHLA